MESDVFLGYTCVCGERVRAFRLKNGEANQLPETLTVACPNGHTATFTAKQVGLLELIVEEPIALTPEDEQAA
jgi:hypothetical protein